MRCTLMACRGAPAQQANVVDFLEFDQQPSAALLQAMRNQASTLLAPAGIQPVWRSLAGSTGGEPFSNVLIVKSKGVCQAPATVEEYASGYQPFAEPVKLGWTKLVEGRVLPWAEVECDSIRRGFERLPRTQRVFGDAKLE